MGKSKWMDCLYCGEDTSNTVEIKTWVADIGISTLVKRCTHCRNYHTLDDNGNLIKYTEDGKE